jgi:hypothetical protein
MSELRASSGGAELLHVNIKPAFTDPKSVLYLIPTKISIAFKLVFVSCNAALAQELVCIPLLADRRIRY